MPPKGTLTRKRCRRFKAEPISKTSPPVKEEYEEKVERKGAKQQTESPIAQVKHKAFKHKAFKHEFKKLRLPLWLEALKPEEAHEVAYGPRPLSPAKLLLSRLGDERIEWQVRIARHLAVTGKKGPFEVGDYLVDIDVLTGELFRVAERSDDGSDHWTCLTTGARVVGSDEDSKDSQGTAIWRMNGSFDGFADLNDAKRLKPAPLHPAKADNNAPLTYRQEDQRLAFSSSRDPPWYEDEEEEQNILKELVGEKVDQGTADN